MALRVLIVAMLAVAGAGCNQLFGLDAPVRGDDGGGGDDGDGGADRDAASADANPDDLDGDGVDNGRDNCPSVYNPRQADEDGDAEINGGDACDLCPHRAAAVPGAPHGNADDDGVGDECDPNVGVKHCMVWFDGFNGPTDEVLSHYQVSGGSWKVAVGAMEQQDLYASLAELTISNTEFASPVVGASGVVQMLPTTGGDSGATPMENSIGVVGARINNGPGTCFGLVMRRLTAPQLAQVALVREGQLSEIVVAEATAPNSQMTPGERIETRLDLLTNAAAPIVTARLPDDYIVETTASGPTQCSQLGRAGMRTHYATFTYSYFFVIEAAGSAPCAPRGP